MLRKEIREFSRSLEALRDFVDFIDPFLDENRDRIFEGRRTHLIPIALATKVLSPDIFPENELSEEKLRSAFDGDIVITEEPRSDEEDKRRAVKIKVSGRDADNYMDAVKELARTERQKGLLYQSSLMNLTNTVEWFMSQLLHKYFEAYPDAVGSKENVFSLNDLKSFGSIEDAKNHLIDTKVENILRGSFEDWIDFLKEKAKLGMAYLDKHRNHLAEVYQRRNIIVHNGGIINSIYLSKVAPEFKREWKVGDRIRISRAYIDNAISLFEETFLLLAAELWHKQTGEETEIADLLTDIAYEHLDKERWVVAEGLSKFIMSGKGLPELSQLFAKLNYWQAVKWQGRYDDIKNEVESADFSGKGLASQLALYALTDKVSEFFHLLPDVVVIKMKSELMGHRITYEDLDTWPIFREIRKDPLYAKFREEHASEFEASCAKPEKETSKSDSLKNESSSQADSSDNPEATS